MFPVVEAFRESGLRRREFADRHGLSVPVLDYWRRRFAEEHAGGFVEVRTGSENFSSAEAALELFLPDGTHVRYSGPLAEALLLRIAERAA